MKLIATWFGCGYSPFAPGTVGSAAAILIAILLHNYANFTAPHFVLLALILVVVNLIGDATNAAIRGDLRTLIGLPIGGALIVYLLSAGVRRQFIATKAAA